MSGYFKDFEQLLYWANFGRFVNDKQGSLRLANESPEETFARLYALAHAALCKECFGLRAYSLCPLCGGTGNIFKLDPPRKR